MRYMRDLLKRLFIPNATNEYAPHSLRTMALCGMTALVIISFSITNVQTLVWITSEWMVSTILPAVIVEDTNEERETDALVPLVRNETLDRAATLKAKHMAANGYFAHVSPEGFSPWHWFDEAGYGFVHAGENLAVFFTDSSEIVDAWMASPTHRENIMNGNYREIGIGTAEGEFEGHETVFVVQLFGTPAATAFAEEISRAEAVPEAEEADVDETAFAVFPGSEPLVAGVAEDGVEATVPTDISVMLAEDETVVMYTDTVATSTGGIAAPVETIAGEDGQEAGLLGYLTKPRIVLQSVYLLIAFFVLCALLLSVAVEVRRQQPMQIAYSIALLAVMYGLFHLHLSVSSGVLIA